MTRLRTSTSNSNCPYCVNFVFIFLCSSSRLCSFVNANSSKITEIPDFYCIIVVLMFLDIFINSLDKHLLNTYYACMLSHFSQIWLFVTLWTVALQAPLSVGFSKARILEWVAKLSSRGSSWPRDWTHVSLCFLHWQVGSLPLVPLGKSKYLLCIPLNGRFRDEQNVLLLERLTI